MTPNIYIYSRSKQSKAKQNKGGFNINWNKIRQNTKKKRLGYVWNIKEKHKTATVKTVATKNRALTSLCIEKFLQQS